MVVLKITNAVRLLKHMSGLLVIFKICIDCFLGHGDLK
jgi:hypothetical protein